MEQEVKHSKNCIKCEENFIWFPSETWWDYQGTEPTKLVKCSHCGCTQALEYNKLINPNYDNRYYEYK